MERVVLTALRYEIVTPTIKIFLRRALQVRQLLIDCELHTAG
jgi:hypothetical protein